jgi:hypothetical protein
LDLLQRAKAIAQSYRALTGKPLGVTGEVAEYEAARLLGLELAPARQAGYDALEVRNGAVRRHQIKGRCLPANAKPGQRIGRISLDHEWDAVLLVLLDEALETREIWEAPRDALVQLLQAPGSKARNERHALAIAQFKRVAVLRWPTAIPGKRPAQASTVPVVAALGRGTDGCP